MILIGKKFILIILLAATIAAGCFFACGSACGSDGDCSKNQVCVKGSCYFGEAYDGAFPPYPIEDLGCRSDSQCGPCESCSQLGLCEKIAGCDTGYFPWPDAGTGKD